MKIAGISTQLIVIFRDVSTRCPGVRDCCRSVSVPVGAARNVVKKLRTPHPIAVVRRRKALLPIVDNATRWSSTSAMLNRLLELRPVVEDLGAANADLHLSSARWEQLKEIAEVLNEPAVCTQRLQAADLSLQERFGRSGCCSRESYVATAQH